MQKAIRQRLAGVGGRGREREVCMRNVAIKDNPLAEEKSCISK